MFNSRNYSFKFTTYNCLLLILGMEMCSCQESPCPSVFRYEYDLQNHLFGTITVPTPTLHDGSIKLNVAISIIGKIAESQKLDHLIEFLGTLENIENKLPLVYKLELPRWNNISAKITYIAINEESLCVGPPLLPTGDITITTVQLNHVLKVLPRNSGNTNYTRKIKRSSISSTSIDSCGKPMSSNFQLIANGMDVDEGAYPWAGALLLGQKPNLKFLCGASLITKKLALTAAHCVSKYSNDNLHLVFGRMNIDDWLDDNSQNANVEKVELHPDYNEETSDADIAILHLSRELIFTSTVSPVCLWKTESDLRNIVDETGVVVWWGQNENYENYRKLQRTLQQLYIPVVSEEECLFSDEAFAYITSSRTFCAGRSDDTISGPCNGAGGSGFYLNSGGTWTIRGIVSRSLLNLSGRCDFKKYVVYVDVAKYTQWIQSFL